jgi:hypothetical protein
MKVSVSFMWIFVFIISHCIRHFLVKAAQILLQVRYRYENRPTVIGNEDGELQFAEEVAGRWGSSKHSIGRLFPANESISLC